MALCKQARTGCPALQKGGTHPVAAGALIEHPTNTNTNKRQPHTPVNNKKPATPTGFDFKKQIVPILEET
jgi:hypothetical protein